MTYKNFLQGRSFNTKETEFIKKFADDNEGTHSSYKSGSFPEFKLIFKTGESKRLYITKMDSDKYKVKNDFNDSISIEGFDSLSKYMNDEL